MSKPLLHFAHANGFPSGSYNKIFSLLENEFEVLHFDMFAHDPRYPVKNGWREQADQLIEYLDESSPGPVIGIGHSFGASITFMAAVKRPDLFKGLVLIEPILFIGWMSKLVAITKFLGLQGRVSPANKTKGRRRHWPDRETAESYFKSRGLFKNFDPECLHNYIEHGLEKDETGYHLRFSVEQEVAIYLNGPHHFDKYDGKLSDMPGFVVSGEHTDAIPVKVIRKFAGQHQFDFQVIDGGHMFPLEQPEFTADLIKNCAHKIVGLNP